MSGALNRNKIELCRVISSCRCDSTYCHEVTRARSNTRGSNKTFTLERTLLQEKQCPMKVFINGNLTCQSAGGACIGQGINHIPFSIISFA
jgi:hypothetical protein